MRLRNSTVLQVDHSQDDGEEYIKPTKKTKVAGSNADFFDTIPSEGSSKPRPKIKDSAAKTSKARTVSDEEDFFMASDSSPRPRPPVPRRPARAVASKKRIMSSEPDDDEDSDFLVLE